MKTFAPQHRYVATLPYGLDCTEGVVRAEPGLFSCDLRTAWSRGGRLTHAFLSRLETHCGVTRATAEWVIDSRVHMLKKGWCPCIPGWHIDDFHRGTDGQPTLGSLPEKLVHYMAIVGDCSRTEFLDGPVSLPDPAPGATVYDHYNRHIQRLLAEKEVYRVGIIPEQIVRFTGSDFHRGVPAEKDGWRWFIRATGYSGRPILNEVRTQVQVYLPVPEAGW